MYMTAVLDLMRSVFLAVPFYAFYARFMRQPRAGLSPAGTRMNREQLPIAVSRNAGWPPAVQVA